MSMQTSQKFIIGSVKLPKTVEGYVNRGIIVKGYFLERKKKYKSGILTVRGYIYQYPLAILY